MLKMKDKKEQDNLIKEYENLRDEIKQKIQLHNSLITFMIGAVITILAFALEKENASLFLLPFGIIIPISMRVAYYRISMLKLSSYIIVYLETEISDLNWETRCSKMTDNSKDDFYNKITISHYFEGLILSVICYMLYIYYHGEVKSLGSAIELFAPVLLILWEAIISFRIAGFYKEMSEWKRKWEDFKTQNM